MYVQLHAYVRRKLAAVYGDHGVDDRSPIPAHLLGTVTFIDEIYLILLYNDHSEF